MYTAHCTPLPLNEFETVESETETIPSKAQQAQAQEQEP